MKRRKALPSDKAAAGRSREEAAAAQRKAPAPREQESSSDFGSEDESEQSEGELTTSEVALDFDLTNPSEEDFHGVKQLLQGDGQSQLADLIVNQGNIGTLVKADNDDQHVCALATLLNPRQYDLASVTKHMLQKARKAGDACHEQLKAVLGKKKHQIGVLFSERVPNVPPDVFGPLHRNLLEDVEWSCTTPECPEDERPYYFFTHVVGLADFSVPKAKKGAASAAERVYARPEERHLVDAATLEFAFKEERRGSTHRALFVLTRAAYERAVAAM